MLLFNNLYLSIIVPPYDPDAAGSPRCQLYGEFIDQIVPASHERVARFHLHASHLPLQEGQPLERDLAVLLLEIALVKEIFLIELKDVYDVTLLSEHMIKRFIINIYDILIIIYTITQLWFKHYKLFYDTNLLLWVDIETI